jgi:hypothetical protein
LPLIGAGSGGLDEARVLAVMTAALAAEPDDIPTTIVRFGSA